MLPASPCALLTSLCCVQELRQTVRSYLADSGCVGFLPTLVTSSRDAYKTVLPRFAVLLREAEFRGRLLGLHLEGPFISPEPGAVGAHDAQHVAPASIEAFQELQGWAEGHIRLLTIAAELPNATDLCRHCVANGTAVSLGHQLAGTEHIAELGRAGASLATHVANGIPNLIHRHHNAIWGVLAEDGITAMIISDGHHLPYPILKSIIRAKSAERVIVTSDIVSVGGLEPGDYSGEAIGLAAGEVARLEPSGKLHMPARECLAGSGSTMLQCMEHLRSLEILSEKELWQVAFRNPLRAIGLSERDVAGYA